MRRIIGDANGLKWADIHMSTIDQHRQSDFRFTSDPPDSKFSLVTNCWKFRSGFNVGNVSFFCDNLIQSFSTAYLVSCC